MKKETVITKSMELELIAAGRKGVTNKQMLEAFKSNPDEKTLLQLLADYPTVFKNSVKYTPDAQKIALEKLVRENGDPNFTVKTGKKIRDIISNGGELKQQVKMVEEPKVEEPKDIIVLEEYKVQNNEKMSKVVSNLEVLTDEEKEIVKYMVEKDLGTTELSKKLGLTKDQLYSRVFRSKNSIYNKLQAAN